MRVRRITAVFMLGVLLSAFAAVPALAKSSDELQEELNQYEDELAKSEAQSADLTTQICDLQQEVGDLTSQVEALNIEMEDYRVDMSARIKYFYEESLSDSVMEIIFGSESFSDLLSRLDYLQSLYDYDARQLEAYDNLIAKSAQKQTKLDEQINEMSHLLDEQETLQDALTASISGTEAEYAKAKDAEEAAAKKAAEEEAAKKAAEEKEAAQKAAAEKEAAEKAAKAEADRKTKQKEEEELTEAAKATVKASTSFGTVENSGGALTKSKGVVYYNGHKETWYSTKEGSAGVVTGIPGRTVGEDGIIRDGDGYICVASSDYPKGTVVETSLGLGKVYDTGCASGTIDIYTTW